MTKPPAFQFYAKDFYASVVSLSLAAKGAYICALTWSWDNGPLPTEPSALARVLTATPGEFKRVWPEIESRFTLTDAGYINRRLEREREKQDAFRNRKSEGGKKGAEQRWHKDGSVNESAIGSPIGSAMPDAMANGWPPSPSPTADQNPPAKIAGESATADALSAAWNEGTTRPLPKCRELSPARRKKALARLRERSLDEWRIVIARLDASDFCRGLTDRGTWVATFDWLIENQDNAVKVLEGKYDNRAGCIKGRSSPQPTYGWIEECQSLHGGKCRNQNAHSMEMQREAVNA